MPTLIEKSPHPVNFKLRFLIGAAGDALCVHTFPAARRCSLGLKRFSACVYTHDIILD